MSFFRRVRRAVRASMETFGAQPYEARGERITCPVCKNQEFVRSNSGAYDKPMLLGFNEPWLELDRNATSLICTHCTYILTFGKAPRLADEERMGR